MTGKRTTTRWLAALGLSLALAVPAAAQETGSSEQEQEAEAAEMELREAERRLEEAAARIAELSRRRLPALEIERFFEGGNRPMLGISIGGDEEEGPVEGVVVRGVTPGGPAAEAGLRSGDVLTAVNDESLGATTSGEADRRLLDFLSGVEEGDVLDVEYLRDGRSGTVSVEPRRMGHDAFAFLRRDGMAPPRAPGPPGAPLAPLFRYFGGHSWGDMELVPLTADLGRYFGTDEGLLVVRAPADERLELRDGDVIHSIDGREPKSVSHALRILGSYQDGEELELEIMRDRKRQKLSIRMPDHRQSALRDREGR